MWWPVFPPMPVGGPPRQVAAKPSARDFAGLHVSYVGTMKMDAKGKVQFSGDVTATYDETKLTTKSLTLDPETTTGKTDGETVIDDPEGKVTCSSLEFNWKKKTSKATDVHLKFPNLRINAETLSIAPGTWELHNADVTLSRSETPKYKLSARDVTVHPGDSGYADHCFLDLYGEHFGPIPRLSFSLDDRVAGFGLPNITNRQGSGIGLNWFSSVLLDQHTGLFASWQSYPLQTPNYGATLAYSPLDPTSDPVSITPGSELDEFASNGYFDKIYVTSPEVETNGVRAPRNSYSVSSTWNASTFGHQPDLTTVSKAIDLAGERGGAVGGFGYIATGRLERIRQDSFSPWVDRAVLQGTLEPKPLRLAEGIDFMARGDTLMSSSSLGHYTGLRAEAGLFFRPSKTFQFGAAAVGAKGWGSSDFAFDRFPVTLAYQFRADWVSGPYTVRYLVKYDPRSRRVFDTEYEFALAAESFEPFISARSFPQDFRIGVRFRIDDFLGQLKHRKTERRADPAP